MYHCTNCGARVEELYKRYCPSVLKLLKCHVCGKIADKYIEYDPAIVLVDLILLHQPAYRHLLQNFPVRNFWKLLVVIWLTESFRVATLCDTHTVICNFYGDLVKTALALIAFGLCVISLTEMKMWWYGKRECETKYILKALVVGGSAKILGLLEIVWRHIALGPGSVMIQCYTILCLLTAYSVVCNSGKVGSFLVVAVGIVAYSCVSNFLSTTAILTIVGQV